jgi:hypothetical protein
MSRVVQVAAVNGRLAPPAILLPADASPDVAASNFTYEVEAWVPRLRCEQEAGITSALGRAFLVQADDLVAASVGSALVRDSLVFADDLSFNYSTRVRISGSSRASTTRASGAFFYAGLVSAYELPAGTTTPNGALVLATPRTRYLAAYDGPDAASHNSTFPDGGLLFALAQPAPAPPLFVSCATYNSSVRAAVDVVGSRAVGVRVLATTDSVRALNFTDLGCRAGAYLGACPQMAYQFYLGSLVRYLAGTWWSADANDLSLAATPHQTGLVSSPDLWNMFEAVSAAYSGQNPWAAAKPSSSSSSSSSSQTPPLTFAAAVEQLALNASLSFMSEPSLSLATNLTTTTAASRQVYLYRPQNLVVSYALGIALTFCALLYGVFTYAQNGRISYDNLLSSIAGAAQHPAMGRLARDRHLDSTLLDRSVYDTRWRLAGYGARDDKRFGFVPVGKDGERIV